MSTWTTERPTVPGFYPAIGSFGGGFIMLLDRHGLWWWSQGEQWSPYSLPKEAGPYRYGPRIEFPEVQVEVKP